MRNVNSIYFVNYKRLMKPTVIALSIAVFLVMSSGVSATRINRDTTKISFIEEAPINEKVYHPHQQDRALWDIQFGYDLEAATGALGNAGAEFDGTYFYTTRWASNLLHKYYMNGT